MSCTSRTIKEACDKSAKFEKSLQPETLFDLWDKDNAKNILGHCYALGYMDAKSISGKWNNAFPTWEDTKCILKSMWGWICNIPPYVISRCGKFGNRKVVEYIKRDIDRLEKSLFSNSSCHTSRNGWKMSLGWMMERKYKNYGLIRNFEVVNNDPDQHKCIWIDEKGLDGCLEVHLRNCNEVVKLQYSLK